MLNPNLSNFGGECSDDEISRCIKHGEQSDVVIGIGGGKTINTAKIVAYKFNACMITVPTIASTDSPTSSLGVIYTPDGIYDLVAKLYRKPDLVLIDSSIIIKAPVRYFASGMGIALSTWFEACSNLDSRSDNYIGDGYATTIAGAKIAQAYNILIHDGRAAYIASKAGCLPQAVENIIEANVLLSDLGFDNCGVSAAHGIHDALTILEPTHHLLHGEKVAFGVICLLVLENRDPKKLEEVIRFCRELRLPTRLKELELENINDQQLLEVGNAAMHPTSVIHSVPLELPAKLIADAIRTAYYISSSL